MVTVILFGASWCVPCKVFKKNLDILERDYPHITFKNYNANDESEMKYFNQYGIASFPTFVIEIDGEIVELIDYNITLRQLENILNKYDPFEEAMYEEE